MIPALFLDRDGVINHDHGYVHRPADFKFIPHIFALCAAARDAGMVIHVVTNQSGIGRGYYTEADFHALSDWMAAAFAERGVPLAGVHFSPHHPQHGVGDYRQKSPRRKPGCGMLTDAAAAHGLDLSRSAMVGDKATDMQAACAAGLPTRILFSDDAAEIAASPDGTLVVGDLLQARDVLIRSRHAP